MTSNNAVKSNKPIGIIVAAGRGKRMGQTKQLVMIKTQQGDKPLIAAAFDSISSVCSKMIVVLGHESQTVSNALKQRDFHIVQSDPDAPMYESIRAGLAEARRLFPTSSILLQPGDHPEVGQATLEAIKAAFNNKTLAIIPTVNGKGGHPVLIPANLIESLIAYSGDGGLRQYWQDNPELSIRIEVDDPLSIYDVDRPEDIK